SPPDSLSLLRPCPCSAPATPHVSPLPLHDALPIFVIDPSDPGAEARYGSTLVALAQRTFPVPWFDNRSTRDRLGYAPVSVNDGRSEEHTAELQSLAYLVCGRLVEKKKNPCSRWALC